MLACTNGSNCAAALNRHLPSSRSALVAGWSPSEHQPNGVCVVFGILLPIAIWAASPSCLYTSPGLAQGTPLTGRNILRSNSHPLFLSAAKARRTLHRSLVPFVSGSFGPLLEAAPGILSGRISEFCGGRTDLPGSLGSALGRASRWRRRREGGALKFTSSRRRA